MPLNSAKFREGLFTQFDQTAARTKIGSIKELNTDKNPQVFLNISMKITFSKEYIVDHCIFVI